MSKITRNNKRKSSGGGKLRREQFTREDDRKDSTDLKYSAQKSRPNDWRWYAQNEQLLKDSASFPYSWPLGTRLNLGDNAPEINKGSIPGVMAIYTSPTFGYADNPNAPINVAARNIYSFVRHANSGHANYDAPDLMLYLCAMDSVYSYISFIKRIYGVVQTYSYTNRYYPKAVVQAMRVDFDDVQANLADFRGYINSLSIKAGSMCIPNSMSYMAKHMWMYEGLYYDSNQDKAQTYMFVPRVLYRYSLDPDGAGALVGYQLHDFLLHLEDTRVSDIDKVHLLTFKEIRTIGNSLLERVLRSEDMNIMSGDILKAFGSEGVYKLSGVDETYTVLPSYDEEVLDQIQNLTLIGDNAVVDPFVDDAWTLRQDKSKGWLKFTPSFAHPYPFELADEEFPGQNAFICNRFVTFEHGDVKPENTMEATRMTNIAEEYTEMGTNKYLVKTLGSEVAHFAFIYSFVESEGAWKLRVSDKIYVGLTHIITFDSAKPFSFTKEMDQPSVDALKTEIAGYFKQFFIDTRDELTRDAVVAQQLSVFNRHPSVSITTGIQDTNKAGGILKTAPAYGRLNGMLFDVNYYTVLDAEDLRVMSETALMSQFNIRQYGRSELK